MTLDELLAREAIRQTLTAYNYAGDTNDPDGFADCYTEDGVMLAWTVQFEGREKIREWRRSTNAFASGGRTALFRVHNLWNSHIEFLSADRAKVRTPFMVVTDIGPDHFAVYYDVFRREGDRWLIEKREIDCLWRAENSYISAAWVSSRSGNHETVRA